MFANFIRNYTSKLTIWGDNCKIFELHRLDSTILHRRVSCCCL